MPQFWNLALVKNNPYLFQNSTSRNHDLITDSPFLVLITYKFFEFQNEEILHPNEPTK